MARTIEFNREEVLAKAMQTFWQYGYAQTSIPNLVSSTKLNPGSIYAAFDSKEGLFLETLDFYGSKSLNSLKQIISTAQSPLAGIKTFFGDLVNKLDDKNEKGCLVVNTLLEMSSHNATIQAKANQQLFAVEAELHEALSNARELGELTADANTKTLAKFLMVNIWGLRVLAKTGTMNKQSQTREEILEHIMSNLIKN